MATLILHVLTLTRLGVLSFSARLGVICGHVNGEHNKSLPDLGEKRRKKLRLTHSRRRRSHLRKKFLRASQAKTSNFIPRAKCPLYLKMRMECGVGYHTRPRKNGLLFSHKVVFSFKDKFWRNVHLTKKPSSLRKALAYVKLYAIGEIYSSLMS